VRNAAASTAGQKLEPKRRAAVLGPPRKIQGRLVVMIGKRVQFHDETWHELQILASESMKSFQELADEAFNDLLAKHGRPTSLKDALRKSAGIDAKIIPLRQKRRTSKKRK
jgi:antitoxin-like ribbon-helix-helix protein